MSIHDATRAAANALCKPAVLNRVSGRSFDERGNVIPAKIDAPINARWAVYTEALSRLGMPDLPMIAHIPDPGFAPTKDDVLTLAGKSMTITKVVRAPAGGVYYAGGQ